MERKIRDLYNSLKNFEVASKWLGPVKMEEDKDIMFTLIMGGKRTTPVFIKRDTLLNSTFEQFADILKREILCISDLTLIYMGGGGGKFAPQAVFCYSSKTVGARLLKLCGFYC